jgi:hypothetical protein
MLRLVPDSLVSHESTASARLHEHDSWEPDWVSSTFTCWLKCDGTCGEPVAVLGTSQPVWDEEAESGNEYIETCQPLITHPMLPAFPLPAETPKPVKEQLEASFQLVWVDPGAAANRLRVSLERLLDHLRIRRLTKNAKGKFETLSLHARIKLYEAKEQRLGAHLMAVKWLGNTASHEGSVSREALLDAFEILEDTLAEMLMRRSEAITKLAKKLTREHQPRKRR